MNKTFEQTLNGLLRKKEDYDRKVAKNGKVRPILVQLKAGEAVTIDPLEDVEVIEYLQSEIASIDKYDAAAPTKIAEINEVIADLND